MTASILPGICTYGRCTAQGAWHRHERVANAWVSACDAHAWIEVGRALPRSA